jgi:hypothetical protein
VYQSLCKHSLGLLGDFPGNGGVINRGCFEKT